MAWDVDPKVIAAISAALSAWLRSRGLSEADWRVADVRRAAGKLEVGKSEVGDE